MRALSERQAGACENAKTGRCACRCGGAYHGASRAADVTQLPEGDPHLPTPVRKRSEDELAAKREAKRLADAREIQGLLQDLWHTGRLVQDTLPL
jgi:hypothetical protein